MRLAKILTGAALCSLLATPAMAEKMVLKFGHVGKPGSLFETSVNAFAACSKAHL